MSSDPAAAAFEVPIGSITLTGVSKCYHIYDRPQHRLKQALLRRWRTYYREFWAVRDLSLAVPAGSALGLVGRNGAGKSTLLQMIAGTICPSAGTVRARGRVAALLELGAGFNFEYTGRENVFLSGAIMGIPRAEMERRFDDIAAFADIGAFIDQPVKSYSTGMFARLAFAVAVCSDPDILLVDEILSVGDAEFQQRCVLRMRQLRERGVTLILTSHSMDTVKSMCDRAVVLEKGQLHFQGSAQDATDAYLNLLRDAMNQQRQQELTDLLARSAPQRPARGSRRYGTGHVQIESVRLLDAAGQEAAAFRFGETVHVEVRYRSFVAVDALNVCYLVRDPTGVELFGTTAFDERVAVPPLGEGQAGCARFTFANPLRRGTYGVVAAVTRVTRRDLSDVVLFDQIDDAAAFETIGDPDRPVWYKLHVPTRIEIVAPSATPPGSTRAAGGAPAQRDQ